MSYPPYESIIDGQLRRHRERLAAKARRGGIIARPSTRLSEPAFVGPTDLAAHYQRRPIPGQLVMFTPVDFDPIPDGCAYCGADDPDAYLECICP